MLFINQKQYDVYKNQQSTNGFKTIYNISENLPLVAYHQFMVRYISNFSKLKIKSSISC